MTVRKPTPTTAARTAAQAQVLGPDPDPTPRHRLPRRANYDRRPQVAVGSRGEVAVGWAEVAARLRDGRVVVVDCYPGVLEQDRAALIAALGADMVIDVEDALLPAAAIDELVAPDLTDDPIFGRVTSLALADLFDPERLDSLRRQVAAAQGRVVVVGTGASLVADGDVLVLADLPRWEIQQRQRRHLVGNLGVDNAHERASLLYKRGYFVDWRLADRHKIALFDRIDHLLDTTVAGAPRMITGATLLHGLRRVASQPFRVVPLFDPGPWGGQWIKEVVDLDRSAVNYAWAFDCVPEENSLLLAFDDEQVEIPALNLVLREPEALMGPVNVERFGAEFPIRFDFLDTMGGGNLSLQVHPLTAYIREHFGVDYTQDESYYYLDAEPDEATVFLGVRDGIDIDAMRADLQAAQRGELDFPAEEFVNRFPARRHDHFLIPAGTAHCSGAGGMVLEISATPYIFTFKLWDWGRLGLDGRPRPINIDRGLANLVATRDTRVTVATLVNQITPLGAGPGWRAERTGLHEAEFIETHRHWFTSPVDHNTAGGVNVLNLVQGEQVTVTSPAGAFAPFDVHFAETFIVPAAVGAYVIRPSGIAEGTTCATIKAFVRGASG